MFILRTYICFRWNSLSQMKHQLDATLCRFYFCRVTLHVSGASAHHQEYLKLVQRPLVHVLSLQVSHHISLLGLELNDDGRSRPKHVEWLCRNKTCTVLHQVGVSFDLYYDARKHKIKIYFLVNVLHNVGPVSSVATATVLRGWTVLG